MAPVYCMHPESEQPNGVRVSESAKRAGIRCGERWQSRGSSNPEDHSRDTPHPQRGEREAVARVIPPRRAYRRPFLNSPPLSCPMNVTGPANTLRGWLRMMAAASSVLMNVTGRGHGAANIKQTPGACSPALQRSRPRYQPLTPVTSAAHIGGKPRGKAARNTGKAARDYPG